jgi:hypothetical protein
MNAHEWQEEFQRMFNAGIQFGNRYTTVVQAA